MSNYIDIVKRLESNYGKTLFSQFYGTKIGMYESQLERYKFVLSEFCKLYGENHDIDLFSTSGRTEIGGNHTDHNQGKVLAGSVDLDTLAAVSKSEDGIIRIQSYTFDPNFVDSSDLEPREIEKYRSNSLVRGICFRMKELGYKIGGFDAFTTSNVLKGSGLSSSAAFEVLVVTILNHLYNDGKISPVEMAQIGQYAENIYFGKPSGLLDQTACAVGGFVAIDFYNPQKPTVEKVELDFAKLGYTLIITDTKGNHSDLNDEYAAVAIEMKSVARELGGNVLREFTKEDVLKNAAMLREKCGDRAILRALHFFAENERVDRELFALRNMDMKTFLHNVIESGDSSWKLNQNCYTMNSREQGVTLGLAVSREILEENGAYRVHGGGFAGTIQAFVPNEKVSEYTCAMSALFGADAPHELFIRPFGSVKLAI